MDLANGSAIATGHTPPLVAFKSVNKSYGSNFFAVRDLDLDVAPGEFLTLLGPSGSGKTTTLMMLAGFEAPTSGEILLAGQPIQRLAPHRRNIGVVFQNYALFPHMTVAENLAYPLKVRGQSSAEIEDGVVAALRMVRMEEFGDRRPAKLSGGQQQRVALARALIFKPSLVLMDEPLGALDKNLREQLQLEIKHIHQSVGVTVIYVTHDQSEALTMSDRIAIFNRGRIEQLDTPSKLYERPATPFVAGFMGDNNALAGEIVDVAGHVCRVRIAGDAIIVADCPKDFAPGDAVIVSVRPERIGLVEGGSDNHLPVQIREILYLGDHLQILAETSPSGQPIKVKLPNTSHLPELRTGQTFSVHWAPRDGTILKR